MEQTEAGRTLGLKAAIAGFWPEDRAADEDEIIASAVDATARMGKKGAHLNKAGAYLAERLTDPRWRDWIVRAIAEMRARGGERIQAAERRHPKHEAWKRKQYDDNTPDLARRLDEARWRYPEGGIGFTVREDSPAYTISWTKGPGEETVVVGTARDAASAAEALIICGLEPESERIETTEVLVRGREMELGTATHGRTMKIGNAKDGGVPAESTCRASPSAFRPTTRPTPSRNFRLHQIASPRLRNVRPSTDDEPDNTTLPRPLLPNTANRRTLF